MKTPAEIIQAARKEGRKALFEHEAKELVRGLGIIVPRSVVVDAQREQEIPDAGEKLGFPVALKAVSAEVLHKTDAGAVVLDIKDKTALAGAVAHMKATVSARVPGAVIRSYLIEKMMPPGLELLIGGMRNEQFGPSVSFGLGGIWVEALKDAVFGILPMTREEMLAMIADTRAGLFLKGFRNNPPLDQEAVLNVITAVSKLMTEYPDIKEIDLNPVRVYAKSAAALDVRAILA